MKTIAALYVMPNGPYAGLPGVEVWDEARDARTYGGPHPVVAHPPCAAWSKLAPVREAKHGLARHEDGGCFASALAAVRRWGGVLEHPRSSAAFAFHGLPNPGPSLWKLEMFGPGAVTQVNQQRYGHQSVKATWLYAVGSTLPLLDWAPGETVDIHQSVAWSTAKARKATPPAFRDLLISMARSVQ